VAAALLVLTLALQFATLATGFVAFATGVTAHARIRRLRWSAWFAFAAALAYTLYFHAWLTGFPATLAGGDMCRSGVPGDDPRIGWLSPCAIALPVVYGAWVGGRSVQRRRDAWLTVGATLMGVAALLVVIASIYLLGVCGS
jgi:hypothetical protein